MVKRHTICVCVLAVLIPLSVCARAAQSTSPDTETVTIDGAKNPELIPQWSAWAFSFRFIAAGAQSLADEGIPTTVYRVLNKEQRLVLLKHVDAAIREQKECESRMLKLRALFATQTLQAVQERAFELQMDCRRATLKARDGLLAELPPDGQVALRAFVESQKQGHTVTVLKADLARFRLPE
jgi:hypothetical protein